VTTIIHVKIIRLAYLLFLSGLVVGLAMASPSLATTTPNGIKSGATEAVKGTINDLLKVLDDETLKQPDQAEERRHEIEKIIKHRVDYEEMARRALGAPWSTLSHRDQHEFVNLFVQLLRDTFVGRIAEHSDEEVVFRGELREHAFAEVKTQMKGRKIDTPVDFRLIHRAHEWRVYDVVIDGVSIVSNYHSQFTSIIRDVSYVGLVKKMKQKAIAVQVFEKSPAP
jgi:phospholipid transport system substrate-binding protein